MHGIGGNETHWTTLCAANKVLDNLIADKKAVPMIIVMPNGRATADPPSSNFMSDFNYYAFFEKDLLQDLMPCRSNGISKLAGKRFPASRRGK